MAPLYLPRVGAFPIFAADHPIIKTASSTELPLSIKKKFALKDQPAPNFILSDQLGRQCSLHDTIKLGRPIVLFFFPLAGSPHCTKESCLFRDAIEVTPIFSVLQAIVIGISQDSPERAKRFTDEHNLSYPILYDHKRKVMETYGVGRTTFGLIDNRATFIIDPSGIVRGLAEGVLNANGHLKFAEKWLIRLEDELSERSKQYYHYIAREGEMIATMNAEKNRLLQVVYGDEGSASHGGLDGFPRYGAAPASPINQTTGIPNSMSRHSLDQERTFLSCADPRETIVESSGSHEKNIWKNWKKFFAQLSSPDDVPPPIVAAHSRRSSDTFSKMNDEQDSPTNSLRSKGMSWASPNNPTRTMSRQRAKSPFGKRMARPSGTLHAPPVPQMTPPRHNVELLDAATNEADHSSTSSTPPSSYSHHARLGSQSSTNHTSSTSPLATFVASGSSNGHSKGQQSVVKPKVTSEVLMVDAPIITRRASTKFNSPSASPMSSQSSHGIHSKSNSVVAPLLSTLQQTHIDQDDVEPRRSCGPSDVPEDADSDEEEVVDQTLLFTKPLPQTPTPPSSIPLTSSPFTPTRQSTASTSSPLNWAKGLRRQSSLSDGRSSPLPGMNKLRSGKKSQPPVVTNQYNHTSWDAGYGRDMSSESESITQPKRASMEMFSKSNHTNGMQRSASALSHLLEPTTTTRSSSSLIHPLSNLRRNRTLSLIQTRNTEDCGSLPESPKTPTAPIPSRSVATNLVLQSLSQTNHSQHSLNRFDSNVNSNYSSPVGVTLSDDARNRVIPRKAPPPVYSLPPRPDSSTTIPQNISISPKDVETAIPIQVAMSPSSSGESYSPNQPNLHSFPSDSSRRASAADSLRSTGTFG